MVKQSNHGSRKYSDSFLIKDDPHFDLTNPALLPITTVAMGTHVISKWAFVLSLAVKKIELSA